MCNFWVCPQVRGSGSRMDQKIRTRSGSFWPWDPDLKDPGLQHWRETPCGCSGSAERHRTSSISVQDTPLPQPNQAWSVQAPVCAECGAISDLLVCAGLLAASAVTARVANRQPDTKQGSKLRRFFALPALLVVSLTSPLSVPACSARRLMSAIIGDPLAS